MYVNLGEQDRESLRQLILHAKIYATEALRSGRQCPPTFFMHSLDGPVMFIPDPLTSERSKDNFVTMAKLMCDAHRATATVFVAEALNRRAKEGESTGVSKMASENPDKQEILLLLGETRYGNDLKRLPILRSDRGQFIGFGEPHVMQSEHVRGRFAQLLPKNFPSAGHQEIAKEALRLIAMEKREERGRDSSSDRGMAMG